MSAEKNAGEALRWLTTAREDLETARVLLANRRYAHACFHAQQAGEKCMKAVWYERDGDPWGHSANKLIRGTEDLDAELFDRLKDLLEPAAKLDRFYVPTRYPNGLPDLTPDQAYFEEDAREAITLAERLIERSTQLLDHIMD